LVGSLHQNIAKRLVREPALRRPDDAWARIDLFVGRSRIVVAERDKAVTLRELSFG